ncbi:Endonuclease/Exonuclease/phosphatase family protein [Rubripirellula obstinata]|uniref:Endonuclease/Exonuclease/phosphatase family protein n=1 Tax=Rubripirellula obstinata TaxID=406547 RepID=A0A5B1CED1_9BACT|nr:endonuclease/exonuclease/phosphatase family protein [Rubripirellula obstinata]KAA1258936.1 Endonuclease/Exonuclease/phosphatase family protein [Rubripirellula obstinata]
MDLLLHTAWMQPTALTEPVQPEPSRPEPIRCEPIQILAWNIESGGNDPEVIALQLKQFGPVDVFALSEVSPRSINKYAEALGPDYQSVVSRTGGADRLQILFRSDRFRLVRSMEMDTLNDGNHRSPLLVHLRDKASGLDFQVVGNHLSRGNAELRESQASGLREWARQQTMATVAIGDFNFDYSFVTEQGNSGFAAMLRDNVWQWVKPVEWVDTNWSDGRFGRGGDGLDDYPDSMLDFAFVAGPARDWNPRCEVIKRPGDFPDDETTSDHRPTELILTP